MNILEEIAAYAKIRVENAKQKISAEKIKFQALSLPRGNFEFEKFLRGDEIAFICEVKKASPSKGLIAEKFPYLQIAREYEAAGANCISVLTEPKYFLGANEFLQEISAAVKIPCLRKDFVVDEYMIYNAKVLGASAVLLICAILDKTQLKKFLAICEELGISALVEAHDEGEIKTALEVGAKVIGVNNRNLKNFSVDFANSQKLRQLVPKDILFVAESGVKTTADVATLKKLEVDAVLIGETLMRADDKKLKLQELKSA